MAASKLEMDDAVALLAGRAALGRLIKSAQGSFIENVVSPPQVAGQTQSYTHPGYGALQGAAIGSGLGLGLGALRAFTDKDRRRHWLSHALYGATLGAGLGGGLAGGYHYLKSDPVKPAPPSRSAFSVGDTRRVMKDEGLLAAIFGGVGDAGPTLGNAIGNATATAITPWRATVENPIGGLPGGVLGATGAHFGMNAARNAVGNYLGKPWAPNGVNQAIVNMPATAVADILGSRHSGQLVTPTLPADQPGPQVPPGNVNVTANPSGRTVGTAFNVPPGNTLNLTEHQYQQLRNNIPAPSRSILGRLGRGTGYVAGTGAGAYLGSMAQDAIMRLIGSR